MDKVIAEKSGTNARGQSYTYRIVERWRITNPDAPVSNIGQYKARREYWVQLSRPDLPWQDVTGPYWQRPAALRKLETY